MQSKKALSGFAKLALLLLVSPGFCAVTINGNEVHQRIDGFGACSALMSRIGLSPLPTAMADMFFSVDKGIGLSLLRDRIDETGVSLEMGLVKQAVSYGVTVWSTPWSPPGKWKSNGDMNNGGYLLPEHYQDYANQQANYVAAMKANGVNIYAISVQNESDLKIEYESCTFSAQQMHDFIPYLYNALAAKGFSSTKIVAAEQCGWGFSLLAATLADPVTRDMLGIFGAHNYGGSASPVNTGGKPLWQTEVCTMGGFNGSMDDAMSWAFRMHDFLTIAEVNAWHYWWLVPLSPTNEGLTDQSRNPAKRMYMMGNFSKFVRPGFYRVGVANTGGMAVSAYKDPATGKFALVVINNSGATSETFSVNGFSAGSVTPWITSESLSLAAQAAVTVSNGSFTYTIPFKSIVTFVGQGGGANTVATPAISPDGGSFVEAVLVTLSTTTAGASIRYTTDGSTPTTSSNLYSVPFTLTAATTVKAIGIKSGMTNSAVATATFTKRDAAVPYQVNCGGNAMPPFGADEGFSGGTANQVTNSISTGGVSNAAPAALYQTERYGDFTYTLTGLTANAAYTVRLHLAELYWSAAGSRIFNLAINGQQILSNFDLYVAAGGAYQALVREFKTTATTSGQVVIQFTSITNYATCSGIEVFRTGTSIGRGKEPGPAAWDRDNIPNPLAAHFLPALVQKGGWELYTLNGIRLGLNQVRVNGVYFIRAEGQGVRKVAVVE